jgi:RNA polymerase sigma-70 factor (ECF subfamily)
VRGCRQPDDGSDYRAGVTASFEDVYEASFRRVTRSIHAIVGADAEDVANEAFAAAWVRWDEVGAYDIPQAWVRKVARRMAIARARRERMRDAREVLATTDHAPSHRADPDLGVALARLSDAARAAVALHYAEDRPLDDVAAALGTITPTVKTWLHRVRPRLAEDVAGLRGRWILEDPISRDALAERAVLAGAGHGVAAVMARMPATRARWVLTVDGGRYLMLNDDGEYFDDGRVRWEDRTIRLRSTEARWGEVTYAIDVDGPVLSIRVGDSTMQPVDGVADAVFHRTMYDRVALTWRGHEPIPTRIYRG